jgi:uncharacterized protein YecE (DUF72 family)
MQGKTGRVWIGTSNVVLPGNKTTFPPAFQQKSRLHYYSSLFNSVEINSSFYKTPLFRSYENWSVDAADDFQFSVKLSREITHARDLEADLGCLEKFLQSAEGIGNKKGCLLVQFPGKITLDYFSQVEKILQELHNYASSYQWKKAIEFRSDTWYIGETKELLNQFDAALVLHDIPKGKMGEVFTKADFVYIRFHGPKGDYRDSYTEQFLKTKAETIKSWALRGKDVYVYFNNTIGNAFENALTLKKNVKI